MDCRFFSSNKYFMNIRNQKNTLRLFLIALWASGSVLFWIVRADIIRSQYLSPSRLHILVPAGILCLLLLFFFFKKFQINLIRSRSQIFLSFLLSLILWFSLPKLFRADIYYLKQFQIKAEFLEPQAEFHIDWLYWAESDSAGKPEDGMKRTGDISFKLFDRKGTWVMNESRQMISRDESDSITLKRGGLYRVLPVVCARTEKGSGVMAVTLNGKTSYVYLNGTDRDASPFAAADSVSRTVHLLNLLGGILSLTFLSACITVPLWKKMEAVLNRLRIQPQEPKFYEQELNSPTKIDWLTVLEAFMISFGIMLLLCIYLKITPFGDHTFLHRDMNAQYVAFLSYVRQILLEGKSIFYSFSKGFGGDVYSMLAVYRNNPIYFAVCFFPTEKLPDAITWIIIFRVALCSLSSGIFFQYFSRSKYQLLFTAAYALMAYNLVNSDNIDFLDGTILLPLVCLGILKIIHQQHSRFYIAFLSILLIINFYLGYMVCIFAVLFFSAAVFAERNKLSHKTILTIWKKFILGSLAAGGISCFILLPIYLNLLSSVKQTLKMTHHFTSLIHFLDIIPKFFSGSYTAGEIQFGGIPTISCGIFILYYAVCFFFCQSISKREKAAGGTLLLIIWISFVDNTLDMIWHCFSYPQGWPHRYSFLFSAVLIYLAFRAFTKEDKPNSYRAVLPLFILGGMILFTFLRGKAFTNTDFLWMETGMAVLLLICTLFLQNQKTLKSIAIIAVCLTDVLAASVQILQVNLSDLPISASFFETRIKDNQPLSQKLEKENPFFYRIGEFSPYGNNDPLLLGYHGASLYTSFNSARQIEFVKRIAGFSQVFYYFKYGHGSTRAMDALLNIKYVISGENIFSNGMTEKQKTPSGKTIFEIPETFPTGISSGKAILAIPEDSKNPFANQNAVFHALFGKTLGKDIFFPASYQKISAHLNPKNGLLNLIYSVQVQNDQNLYVFFPSDVIWIGDLSINGKTLIHDKDKLYNGIINLGKRRPGEKLTITVTAVVNDRADQKEIDAFSSPRFYYEDERVIENSVRQANQNAFHIRSFSEDHIEGDIQINQPNRLLFMTIPYDEGWQLKIDGKKSDIIPVVHDLSAAFISPGRHQIELRYIPQGFVAGCVISILSLAICVIHLIHSQRREKTGK